MIEDGICKRIVNQVNLLQKELIDLTSSMIRIPSVNPCLDTVKYDETVGGETRLNAFLEPVFREMGLETDLWEVEKGRANLVGVCRGGRSGRSLIFNGHVDTVSPGPLEKWTLADPFSGAIFDGKIFGRGATDMKGGNAAAIIGLKALLQAGFRPGGDVILEMVSGEEMMNTSIGTGAALERGYYADAAIVMEPSGASYPLAIVSTSPGALILTIKIQGKAAHTLLRHELIRAGGLGAEVAVSAVDKGIFVYQALCLLEEEWGQTKSHPAFTQPGCFTLCPTTFAGGLNGIAFIPDQCELKYVIWHAPQDTAEQVKNEINQQIQRFIRMDSWLQDNPPMLDWNNYWWPPYDLSVDSPICITAKEAYQQLFQRNVEPVGFMGVDDASFLNSAGIPTITMGPGSTRDAHTANEHIEIAELMDAAKLYAMTIVEWSGVS